MMEPTESSSYLQRALWSQYNVILLAGALVFGIALASFVPVLVGLVGEALWLLIAPRSAAFQRRVDKSRADQQNAHKQAAVRLQLQELEPVYAARFHALQAQVGEIQAAIAQKPGFAHADTRAALDKLDAMGGSFLKLAEIHQRLQNFLAGTPSGELEQEVAELSRKMSAEKDLSVRLTLRHALSLAQRRAQQRQQMTSTHRAVELELSTVERSVAYMKTQVRGLASPRELLQEMEAMSSQVGSVAALDAATREGLVSPGQATIERSLGVQEVRSG